jgi:transglutaminase-like putative cysteine protease
MDMDVEPEETYLTATKLCNHDDPSVRSRAESVAAGARTPEERAQSVFRYVRDDIRFSLAYSRSRASQTLRKGYGDCGSKTNAQIALLRALGIPARLRWVLARTQVLKGLVEEFVYRHLPPQASHFWCECLLGDRWISCEALLDRPLYEGMIQSGLATAEQIPSIDWDGVSDLVLLTPWIVEDRGRLPVYDVAIEAMVAGDEGMPPLLVERAIAPVFYRFNLRNPNRVRRRASRGGRAC